MKTHFWILLFSLTFGLSVTAQIKFEKMTLTEAKAKAKKENKPIFVDVYATWCGPCKHMAATAFVNSDVAALYNANFINVKVNGESVAEDGPKTMQEYGISAYPTLLYINPDGSLFRKVVGGMDANSLLAKGKEAMDPASSMTAKARKAFFSSKKTEKDYLNFIQAMVTDEADSLDYYAKYYYYENYSIDLSNPTGLMIFLKAEVNSKSEHSEYFLKHSEEFSPQDYTEKIKTWINDAFKKSLEQNNYSIIEQEVTYLHPYWSKMEELPDLATYLNYVKTQYDKVKSQEGK